MSKVLQTTSFQRDSVSGFFGGFSVLLRNLGSSFLIVVALETGLEIDGRTRRCRIQCSMGGIAKSLNLAPLQHYKSDLPPTASGPMLVEKHPTWPDDCKKADGEQTHPLGAPAQGAGELGGRGQRLVEFQGRLMYLRFVFSGGAQELRRFGVNAPE